MKNETIDMQDNTLLDLVELQKKLLENLQFQFQNNLIAFKEFMPDIYHRFKNYKVKNPFEFFCMDNGVANIQFKNSGKIFYSCNNPQTYTDEDVIQFLKETTPKKTFYKDEVDVFGQIHHRYNNEIVNLLNKNNINLDNKSNTLYDLKAMPFLILYGLGLGYPLSSLYSNIEIADLFVIEPDEDMFYASLYAFDYASLLIFLNDNNYSLHLCIGKTDEDALLDLINFCQIEGKFLSACSSFFIHNITDDIKDTFNYILKNYNKIHSSLGFFDDNMFGLSHALNHIKNNIKFLNSKKHLSRDITKAPVFLVGNGPSLDKDINFIKKHQDKAIIVACGTAIDTLYNEGVKVDFFAAVERAAATAETLTMFENTNYLDDIILFTIDVIHPITISKFKHVAMFSKQDDPFYILLSNNNKTKNIANHLQNANYTNPLVANLGLASLLYLGFDNIYLFGVDNGKRDGCNLHAKSSSLYQKFGALENTENHILSQKREANFGGYVETNYIFNLSADYLDRLIFCFQEENTLKVFNCSDGQKIQNAIPLKSSEIDTKSWSDINKQNILQEFTNKITFNPELNLDSIASLIDKDKYSTFVNKIITILKSEIKSKIDFTNKMKEVNYLLNQTKDNAFNAYMLEGSTQSLFILIQDALYHYQDDAKSLDVAKEALELFIYFLEDSKKIFSFLPNYILEQHKELTNYKVGFDHTKSKSLDAPKDFVVIQLKDKILGNVAPFVKRYE